MSNVEELKAKISEAIRSGDENLSADYARQAVDEQVDPASILEDVIIPTLKDIGERFGRLEIFLPEMMMAAEAAKAVVSIVEPVLKEQKGQSMTVGSVIIGTVAGDVHDIGKNMVSTMLEVNGFEVNDLGTDVSVETFLSTARSQGADIIAMSSLLTTSLPYMKDLLAVRSETGETDSFKVIVGGGPITAEWAKEHGADGYGKDASEAVELARSLIG
jgi:methanogenic corrinoid protein MtbC1